MSKFGLHERRNLVELWMIHYVILHESAVFVDTAENGSTNEIRLAAPQNFSMRYRPVKSSAEVHGPRRTARSEETRSSVAVFALLPHVPMALPGWDT